MRSGDESAASDGSALPLPFSGLLRAPGVDRQVQEVLELAALERNRVHGVDSLLVCEQA